MGIEIREITTKKELKKFITFQWDLYKGVAPFVPPMMEFEMSTLSKDKNPAFKTDQGRFWMAFKDNVPVGRICGIIGAEESKKTKHIRFGWIDFIDDLEVSTALINTVESWGKQEGLDKIHGPLGFSDLDFEGTLVSGFNQISTQATMYNYPYYQEHFKHMGFSKVVDWTEARIKVPLGDKELIDDLSRKADLISKRYGIHIKEFKSGKEILKYANDFFDLLNETYGHLYGFHKLTDEQVKYYVDSYFGFVQKDFIAMVVDDNDKLIGAAVTFPSLSKAFKKAKGRMYPFGVIHVLKSFFFNDTIDFFLVATRKDYQKKGVNALLWKRLLWACEKHKIKYVFSGQMLEENDSVNNLWAKFPSAKDEEIRRRCYTKLIS
ncbi:MAG: N-acetyltransferase [Rickettsiales bacterium]|nr:N-acetyltransferase [Rickettsiales bacterium]